MPTADINYLAVLVVAIVAMVIGAVWYSTSLFGRAWMKETGTKMDAGGSATTGYVIAFVSSLVIAYVLSNFVDYAGATNVMDGAITGFWAWLGFVATTTAMNYVFEGRSWKLFWINTGMQLVNIVVAGAILAVWQ